MKTCPGCGSPLPDAPPRRGRAARYCNATCRQRAHRARHAGDNADILAALDDLAHAVVQARRAVLSGTDTTETADRIRETAHAAVMLLKPEETPTDRHPNSGGGTVPVQSPRSPRRGKPAIDTTTARLVPRDNGEGDRVMVDTPNGPVTLGHVVPRYTPGRRQSGWWPKTAAMHAIAGGSCTTREDALLRVLDHATRKQR